MSENTKIAFIVEGTRTEPMLIQNIQKTFFTKTKIEFIILPNGTSIYALSKQMEYDNSYTNIIEIIKEKSIHQDNRRIDKFNSQDFRNLNRDDYSEVYLFFDYDGHIDLPKVKIIMK
ncbi:MAG: hypothetical protein LUG12_07145 [Erysipelotrichaceae bacterium]|nr:hypothetical protein [Erysipelotrichaceae bacterium]